MDYEIEFTKNACGKVFVNAYDLIAYLSREIYKATVEIIGEDEPDTAIVEVNYRGQTYELDARTVQIAFAKLGAELEFAARKERDT